MEAGASSEPSRLQPPKFPEGNTEVISFIKQQLPRYFNGVRVAAEVSDANARRLRKQEIMRKERKVKHGKEAFQSGAKRTSNGDGR